MIPGAIGIGIAILWWFTDSRHTPPAQPIADAAPTLPEPVDEGDASIRGLMHDKRFWAIIAARMLSDPVWYFYLFWIPGYLQERAGLSLSELGVVGGLPFLAAVPVGMVLGRVVDRFTERGHDSIRVQLWIFALPAALLPLGARSEEHTSELQSL